MKQLIVLTLLILLSACTPEISTKPDSSRQTATAPQIDAQAAYALSLYEANDFINAAALLEELAYRQPPEGWHYQLLAADAYMHLGNTEKALTLIDLLRNMQLDINDSLLLSLLQASLYLHGFDPESALQTLGFTPDINSDIQLQQRYYLLLAEAWRLNGNQLESANALQQLDKMLFSDPEKRLDNQLAIIRTLSSLSETALQMLQPSPAGELGGWMELTRLIKMHGQSMEEITPLIAVWREQFAGHPAMPELLGGYFRNLEAQYLQASHIAVLLPESGRYKNAAQAIRQGLVAAWYNSSPASRPVLRFYDSSDTGNIWPLYLEATQRGADFVIGPLQKESVSQLLNAGDLPVPVLSLNQVSENVAPPQNFYQFSLSPEDEARQVAERAWLDGKRQPVVLSPAGNWGSRIQQAFATRWQQLGGEISEVQSYDSSQNDFAAPIKMLLDIDLSEQRKNSLQRVLGQNLSFEPRRREDIDFIFIIAKPEKARQIRPQLQFHHALGLPIYATSHVWNGYEEIDGNRDIDDVIFPDIPWLLINEGDQPLSLQTMKTTLDLGQSRLLRLIAMGIDSYLLTGHLARLQGIDTETLDGKTGQLYMDVLKNIHRQLVWAKMKNSKPAVIGFAPRIPVNLAVINQASTTETQPADDASPAAETSRLGIPQQPDNKPPL